MLTATGLVFRGKIIDQAGKREQKICPALGLVRSFLPSKCLLYVQQYFSLGLQRSFSYSCKLSSVFVVQAPVNHAHAKILAGFHRSSFTHFFHIFRCPHLTKEYSVAIPIYDGIVTLIVLASFANASVKDPGIIPRGKEGFFVKLFKLILITFPSWSRHLFRQLL